MIAMCAMCAVYAQSRDDRRSAKTPLCRCKSLYPQEEHASNASLLAGRQHVPDHAYQCSILHGSGNTLLVSELLVDCIRCSVCALLQTHINAEAWRQGILQSHAHGESDDGAQTAVSGGRCEEDSDGGDARCRA